MVATTVGLLGGFTLQRDGSLVDTPRSVQRVIALLALRGLPLRRAHIAGTLWADSSEKDAAGKLRAALWRLGRQVDGLVDVHAGSLALLPEVTVDVREMTACASRVLDADDVVVPGRPNAIELANDLLPDWYEEWLVFERERLRLLRLHALEALARQLLAEGRAWDATQAARYAIESDVLRETAHRVLIEVFLSEGNHNAAVTQYRTYQRVLLEETGLEPSPAISLLVSPLLAN